MNEIKFEDPQLWMNRPSRSRDTREPQGDLKFPDFPNQWNKGAPQEGVSLPPNRNQGSSAGGSVSWKEEDWMNPRQVMDHTTRDVPFPDHFQQTFVKNNNNNNNNNSRSNGMSGRAGDPEKSGFPELPFPNHPSAQGFGGANFYPSNQPYGAGGNMGPGAGGPGGPPHPSMMYGRGGPGGGGFGDGPGMGPYGGRGGGGGGGGGMGPVGRGNSTFFRNMFNQLL